MNVEVKAGRGRAAKKARNGQGSMRFYPERGLWVAQVTIGGKRKQVAAKTQGDCQRKLDEAVYALRHGVVITRRVGLTMGDVLDHWLTTSLPNDPKVKAPGTRLMHASNARRWKGLIGPRPAASLTVDDVERAYKAVALGTDKRDGKISRKPSGVKHLQRMGDTLRKAVADGVRRGVLNESVAKVVTTAQVPTGIAAPKGERRALTVDEMRRLLDASSTHRLHAMFVTALSLGMRPGELSGLHWDDLHLDDARPYLEVNRASQIQDNGRHKVVEVLKTSGSYRDLALSPFVVDALREHRRAQNVERIAAKSWPQPDLVFASTRGTLLNPSNVRREFTAVCALAGVDRIVPYETRHSFATMLAESTMNTFAIADMLGHRDDRMLARSYRKKRKGLVSDAVAVIDDNIFRVVP